MGGRDEILEQNFIQKKLKRGDNVEYISVEYSKTIK